MPVLDGPFFPGAGTSPWRLEGREEEIRLWERVMADFAMFGRTQARHLVIQGVRGVGKTSLLKEFAETALREGCLAIRVRCQSSGRESLMDRIRASLDQALEQEQPTRRSAVTGVEVRTPLGGFGLERQVSEADPTLLDSAFMGSVLAATAQVVHRGGIGLAILVDETQYADRRSLVNLSELVSVIGEQDADRPPFHLAFAGLPKDTAAKVTRSSSHAERVYRRIDLGHLDPDSARDALQLPVQAAGGRWTEPALDLAVEASGCYPAFIQEYGAAIWELRHTDEQGIAVLDERVAARGIELAGPQIESYFDAAWEAAPPLGRQCLVALAEAGGQLRMGELASAVGKSSSSEISWVVDDLTRRGTCLKPARGVVVFGRAGMQDWVLERAADEGIA
ncbi:MAG TPA: AAA family ATPase [Candidatus Avipropionibacterium avicola]|uniref:AAA family ATPase n=1 Tax=Candidatus Avipropionibacterium avicola TaxID=2840701 RepID=A0A9D1H1T5_9ACTN|nr:AAA family ATPase [Candidatus Avipropionibacterium avicola]